MSNLIYERKWLDGPPTVPVPLGWSVANQERWRWLAPESSIGRWVHRLRAPAVTVHDVRGMPGPARYISSQTLDARELKESDAGRKSQVRAQTKAVRAVLVFHIVLLTYYLCSHRVSASVLDLIFLSCVLEFC